MVTRRLAVWVGGAGVLALALAALLRGGASCGDGRGDEARVSEIPGRRPALEMSRGELDAGRLGGEDVSAASESVAPATAPSTEAPDFPSLLVEVREVDGTFVRGSALYALPAGAPGVVGDREAVPTADAADGTGELRVPAAGRFDVGVLVDPMRHALVEDVDVPRDRPLVVTLEPLGDVRLAFVPEVASRFRGDSGSEELSIEVGGDARRVAFPGRGERREGRFLVRAPRERGPIGLPRGTRFRASFGTQDLRTQVIPREFTAPADLEVVPGFAVEHLVEFLPPGATFPYDVVIAIDFDWAGLRNHVPFRLRKGSTLATLGARSTQETDRASGRVAWSGRFVEPGTATFRASSEWGRGEVLRIPIPVRDPSPAPSQTDARPLLRIANWDQLPNGLRVEIGCDGAAWWFGDGHGAPSARVPLDEAGEWAHAFADPDWVAGPVRIDGGDTDLSLVRGGFLVAVPESLPPAGLVARLERADGAPMLVEGSPYSSPPRLVPGLVIGPFEPGDVRFRVRVGATTLAEAEATVAAGRYRPLLIPAIAPAPR